MKNFWRFFRQIFRYKQLLALAACASMLDAACAFAGFASMMWVIDQLFKPGMSAQTLIIGKLSRPWVIDTFGDPAPMIKQIIPESQFGGFLAIMIIILFFTLLGSLMRYCHQVLAVTAVVRTIARIRVTAYRHVMRMPYDVQVKRGPADLISRIRADANTLGAGIKILLGTSVRNVLMGIAMLALAVLIDWKLTLLFLCGLPVIGLLIRKFGKRMRRITRRVLEQSANLLRLLQQSLTNFNVVKLQQAEGFERHRFNNVIRELVNQELKAVKVRAISPPMVQIFAIIGIMVIACIAAWYVFYQREDPANIVKVIAALGFGASSFKPLANLHNELQASAAAADRIDELFNLRQEDVVINASKRRVLPIHRKSIRFEHVSYTYPGSQTPAIQNVSFEVDFGMTVAIVGPNGAGKSTLMSPLPRLIVPQEGAIHIDDFDITKVTLRSLRRQIAVVSQSTGLFKGTIAMNIAYGSGEVSDQRIEAAAKTAFADEFIRELPEGYQSRLSEYGAGLSGGQKQRLCIARAILRNPSILILDEATSQVDADSEAKIAAALETIKQGRTTFIIAHRLSTVVHADMILVMDRGQIVASGRHEQLLKTSPLYRTLSQTQLVAGDSPT